MRDHSASPRDCRCGILDPGRPHEAQYQRVDNVVLTVTECDVTKLIQYLDRQLNLDERLEVLLHLDWCFSCRHSVYCIVRERDAALFTPALALEDEQPARGDYIEAV